MVFSGGALIAVAGLLAAAAAVCRRRRRRRGVATAAPPCSGRREESLVLVLEQNQNLTRKTNQSSGLVSGSSSAQVRHDPFQKPIRQASPQVGSSAV